jgi:hypothetical protein
MKQIMGAQREKNIFDIIGFLHDSNPDFIKRNHVWRQADN